VSRVEVVDVDQRESTLAFTVTVNGERFDAHVRSNLPLVTDRTDPAVPVALLAAMRHRGGLHVPGGVSAGLLRNVDRAQDILQSFTGGLLTRTHVRADPAPPAVPGAGVACFFSGGVDSCYSALRHDEEVTHLIFVVGVDAFDPSSARAEAGLEAARSAAAALGKELVEVTTDVQVLSELFATRPWCRGPALGAVALALQPNFRHVLVPASFTYADVFPWGLHPLLDPLWGTESLELQHDGAEATRVEKIRRVAHSDAALAHLRVCNKQGATMNCGRCRKCLGTMLGLRLAGALDRCPTLPHEIRARDVHRVSFDAPVRLGWSDGLRESRRVRDRPAELAYAWAMRPRPLRRVRALARTVRDELRRRRRR
jgi:hypothetical protein